jgi:hypothetical protein
MIDHYDEEYFKIINEPMSPLTPLEEDLRGFLEYHDGLNTELGEHSHTVLIEDYLQWLAKEEGVSYE